MALFEGPAQQSEAFFLLCCRYVKVLLSFMQSSLNIDFTQEHKFLLNEAVTTELSHPVKKSIPGVVL